MMNKVLIFKTSLRSLAHHKIRSSLTMLGIIVGIAAMVATLAIGQGAQERINKELLAMGDNYIFIHAGNWSNDEQKKTIRSKKTSHLTTDDSDALATQCTCIKYITPNLFFSLPISYQGTLITSEVKAGNDQFLKVIGRKIKKGSSFTQQHLQKNARCVIIGAKAAKTLFKSLNPLQQIIKIGQHYFTVIGVLEPIENFFGVKDPNLDLFIPITTARKCFVKKYFLNRVAGITISAQTHSQIPEVVRQARSIIRSRHALEHSEPDDFMIYDQMSMMKAAQASSAVLNLLLIIIASISLLVGGIGVMNIMLVCVRERTQEIGIRMSLGATDRTIMEQFLYESIMLCCIGGLFGILLGIASSYITQTFTTWNIIITPSSILLASSVIVIIGLVFGYYPAYKASKLPPVIALHNA